MNQSHSPQRHILHADLDAFYASVEQMDRPELREKPVLVGGPPEGRSVVAACSYEARVFGIRSGMPMWKALKMCPSASVISPRFDRYRNVSAQVMQIFREITPAVEPLSIDEAYLDVTPLIDDATLPGDIAEVVKNRVRHEVGLVISIGVATSKGVAKIASSHNKPDGLVVVSPGTEASFLAPLEIRQLPGIGPRAEERLLESGIRVLGDLARQPEPWLLQTFGKRGLEFGRMSRGEDARPVVPVRPTKSISAEVTFLEDLSDSEHLHQQVAYLSERVSQRLIRNGHEGRTITLKLRLANFNTFTRSKTVSSPVSSTWIIQGLAEELLQKEIGEGQKFRLLGLEISNFNSFKQLVLFDE